MQFDLIVIGSGPGGYVAAIRASQLGMKVAVVEKAELGGICLNWGCIPTKALLKSAEVLSTIKSAQQYGIQISGEIKTDFSAVIKRSRDVAQMMSKGIQFLFKKNNITLIEGTGKLTADKKVVVEKKDGSIEVLESSHIIIATGARAKQLPHIPIDGNKIISYREALTLQNQPKKMLVMGSGAIGVELAYFYQTLGTEVTLVEYLPRIIPLEDEEASKELERAFKKAGMKIYTGAEVKKVEIEGNICKSFIQTTKGEEIVETDLVLSAVGVTANIENIGLEELGIRVEKGKILVDEFYRTNVDGIYAIGDVIPTPALAHVASHEGIVCVEKIAGKNPKPINYRRIPSAIYTSPEVASVGLTEKAAIEAGYEIKVGKFPFTASGKAKASGHIAGFVKLIFDAKYGQLLGATLVGEHVTEMIAELVVAMELETTGHELIRSIHPHPTLSEAIMEAAAQAYGEVIHL